MRPCHAAPALETAMSTPPKASTTLSNAARTEAASVTSHFTASAFAADGFGFFLCGVFVDVEQCDFGAGGGERLGGGGADRAGGAGDDRDLAGERQSLRVAELGLLQRPIFAIEHLGFADGFERADRLRVGDALDGVSARSAATIASRLVSPSPNRPSPGTSATRGSGSPIILRAPKRVLLRSK